MLLLGGGDGHCHKKKELLGLPTTSSTPEVSRRVKRSPVKRNILQCRFNFSRIGWIWKGDAGLTSWRAQRSPQSFSASLVARWRGEAGRLWFSSSAKSLKKANLCSTAVLGHYCAAARLQKSKRAFLCKYWVWLVTVTPDNTGCALGQVVTTSICKAWLCSGCEQSSTSWQSWAVLTKKEKRKISLCRNCERNRNQELWEK